MAVERHREALVADVEDTALEHVDELDDLASHGRRRLDGDEQQLALDRVVRVELGDLHHVDELERAAW